MRSLLLALPLLLWAAASAQAALPPVSVAAVPTLAGEVRLDGRLDEPIWREAAYLGPLVRPDGTAMPAAATIARLFATADRLLLGVQCDEPEMARLQSAPAKHDAQVWAGDCIELFIQPDGKGAYYHFITNADGARYDERERDGAWNAEWEARGHREETGWSVELAIPWTALGNPPQPGARWRLNVCRSRRPQPEICAWSATGSGFHVPDRFGEVCFGASAWLSDLDWGQPWTGAQQVSVRATGGALSVGVGRSPAVRVAPGAATPVAYTATGEGSVPLVLTARAGRSIVSRQSYVLHVEPLQPALRAATAALADAAAKSAVARRLPLPARAAITAQRRALASTLTRLRARAANPSLSREQRQALIPALEQLAVDSGHLSLRTEEAAAAGRAFPYSLGLASSLVKLLPVRPFTGPAARVLRLSAARNEVAAAQLVLVAHKQALEDVTLSFDGPDGANAPRLAWRRVGLVTTRQPTYAVEHVGEWPDPLLPAAPFTVARGERVVLWIDVRVPEGARPGEHRATLHVRPANAPARALPVVIRVRNFTIPREHHLRTAFGLSPGNDANWDEWMRNYLDHRISPYHPGGEAKILTRPGFDWTGATALQAQVRVDRPVGLRLQLDTTQGRVGIGPVSVAPGGWQEVRFALPALEEPISAFHFALEPFGAAVLELDDVRVLYPTGAAPNWRQVDSCESTEGWDAGGAWSRCRVITDAPERGGALRWEVRPTLLAGWLDRWPMLTRRPDPDAGIPLRLDFSAFDAAVERYLPLGLGSFIVPLPSVSRETEEPEAAALMAQNHAGPLAAAWQQHLQEKGWLERGYTYLFDEPEPEHYATLNRVMGTIKLAAPGIRNMMTARAFPEALKYVDIWCPEVYSFNPEAARAEQERGKEIWWYVAFSTRHPYPNFWVDYPALDCRVLFWMTWKHNLDGVLYWSGTYWAVDPWKDPMTFPGANGDGSLLYPGPNREPIDSIRWECIRDGVEDYEVFCLLEAARDALRDEPRAARLVREADALLRIDPRVVRSYKEYNPDPEALLRARARMDDCLERCIRILGREPQVTRRPRFPEPLPPTPLPPLTEPAPATTDQELPPLPEPTPEPDLVARFDFPDPWPFAVDASGLGNHGLILGGQRAEGPGGRPALVFTGDQDGVRLPGGSALLGAEPTEGSLALWVRPDFDPATQPTGAWEGHQVIAYLMETDGNGLPDGYDEIGLHLHARMLHARAGGLNQGPFAVVPSPLRQGEWTHLALTFAPGQRVLYINGQQAAVDTAAYPPPKLDLFAGALGYHPASNRWRFRGAIADARLYRRALSAAEVAALAR
ncbi:MAG: DUF4091 domain-containing protein [Armatimonadetes bacterium]|nr:DUF4091 domain-containing protein [Armatimonadota bacterium]